MDSRRNLPPAYDEHARMMRRGPLPPTQHHLEPLPPEVLENRLASQAAEIEQLSSDNRKLAASYLSLRQDLAAAKEEAEKIREHMRSIQNEGDIQIRILLDKIAKKDADTGDVDTIKKELQAAHAEARSLMTAKLELSVKLAQAMKEWDHSCKNVEKNPEMRKELDSLRQEHQRLHKTFEYEKCSNIEKVEQMKILEKDLIGIAEEVERLRAELLKAETRASAPISFTAPYTSLDNGYTHHYNGSGVYADSFGRTHPHTVNGAPMEMMNPYASGGFPVGPQVMRGPVPVAPGNTAWGGVYSSPPAVDAEAMNALVSSGAGNTVCENALVSSGAGNTVCEEVNETSNAQI